MLTPTTHAWSEDEALGGYLGRRGINRRDFLEFCGQMAAVLGLSSLAVPRIAAAMESLRRPSVIWLQLQECTGCVESAIRTADPTIGNLLLDVVSLDFMDTLMAASGTAAEGALETARKENAGKYLLVVTGSVPTGENGIYTMIGGRTARSLLEETAKDAAAVIAVGACAHWGSVQASKPNPTGAVGVSDIVRDKPVLNIAGCPPIAEVITATVVHFLTFGRLPAVDADGRPLFAYGNRIHDQCPRRAHYDAGQFVDTFDDAAARQGWCLYEVGCKGPATFSPCPIFMWNGHTDFPIGAGHPCIGCTERNFWDTMSPFYHRLPNVAGVGVEHTADILGAALAVGAAAGIAAHAAATGIYQIRSRHTDSGSPSPNATGREDSHGEN
ncbi:MAG: hydrogenase small subunit [Gemmatimonadota bacterium]|nr:hydrogenase small subunit [Gemmatimonadota bacterium]MDE3216232.1 hydrogenase small subunit [Gemmatimonadota bacterium]